MERISWKSLFLPLSAADTACAASALHTAMAEAFGRPMKMDIKCLGSLPYTSTFMHDDDVMDWMAEQNAAKVFARFDTVDDPAFKAAFDRAAYVEVIIHPVEADRHDTTFGHITAKGNAPRAIAFYVQGRSDSATACAEVIRALRAAKPFGLRLGDGYEWHE